MRPASPLQVTIAGFGRWRGGVAIAMLATAVTTVAWLVALQPDLLPAGGFGRIASVVATLLGLGAAATLLARRPLSLRWDAQRWHVGPETSVGHQLHAGRLRVAIDLGDWMLLRFDPDGSPAGRVVRWIPVQRSSIGQAWHGLRCAVYSPRPESGDSLDSILPASPRPKPPA